LFEPEFKNIYMQIRNAGFQRYNGVFNLIKSKISLFYIYVNRCCRYLYHISHSLLLFSFYVVSNVSNAQTNLGNFSGKGTLHRSIPIGALPVGSIELQHRTNFEGRGPHNVVSEWHVPALFSYAGPEGRRHVIWMRPGGTVERFTNRQVLRRAPDVLTEAWTAVSDGAAGDYRFLGRDGTVYIYKQGQIQELHLPGGREFRFDTDGPRITRIRQRGSNTPLLRAVYNNSGHLTDLQIGEVRHRFAYSRNTELLDAWRVSVSEKSTRFAYNDGLLTRISFPDGTVENYKWRKDLRGYEAETGLELPDPKPKALLAADDQFRYHWGISRQGVNLVRIDGAGKRVGIIINPNTNEVIQVNRDGGELMYFYALQRENGAGKLKEIRAPDGRRMLENRYDARHNLIYRNAAGKPAEVFEYDARNRLISKGRVGMEKQIVYAYGEDHDNPVSITNVLGHRIEIQYDSNGRVTAFKDLNGGVHLFEYDNLGRLVKREYPLGFFEAWTFDAHGRVTEHRSLDGKTNRFVYDQHGRLASWTDGEAVYSKGFDAIGRVAEISRGNQVIQSLEHHVTAGGRVVRSTDEMGQMMEREFNNLGRIQRERNALGHEIEYDYTPSGDLAGWTDARGVRAQLERDEGGRISGILNDLGQQEIRAYNAAGRIRTRVSGEQTITYRHDREGRITRIDYGNGQVVSHKYDQTGRLTRSRSGEVTTHYLYDDLDRVLGIREEIPGGFATHLVYTYAPDGQKASVRFTRLLNGQMITDVTTRYERDLLGRVTEVTLNDKKEVVYHYPPGQLQVGTKFYANGIRHQYDYDGGGRPLRVAVFREAELVRGIAYTWNERGQLTHRAIYTGSEIAGVEGE